MAGKLIEELLDTLKLDNGLVLEMYDGSRHVAGDRCQVNFLARIEVVITPENTEALGNMNIEIGDIQSVLGEKVEFRFEQRRNFIDDKKKNELLGEMKDTFLKYNLAYLARPDFSQKLILRKYREKKLGLPSIKKF